MNQKTTTLPLKDQLIAHTAEQVGINEKICEKVINWAYKDAKESAHQYNEIEISGFGKLIVSSTKLKNRVAKFEAIRRGTQSKLTESPTSALEKRVKSVDDTLEFLKTKTK